MLRFGKIRDVFRPRKIQVSLLTALNSNLTVNLNLSLKEQAIQIESH